MGVIGRVRGVVRLGCLSAGVLRTDIMDQSLPRTMANRAKAGNGGGGVEGGEGGIGGIGGFAMNVIPGTPLEGVFDDSGGNGNEERVGLVRRSSDVGGSKRRTLSTSMWLRGRGSGASAYSTATSTTSGRSLGWWDRISWKVSETGAGRASGSSTMRHSHSSSVPMMGLGLGLGYGRIDSPPPPLPPSKTSSVDYHRQV